MILTSLKFYSSEEKMSLHIWTQKHKSKKYRSIGTSAGTIFLWDFEPRPFLTVFNSQNDLELTSRYQCILKKQKAVVSVLSAFIKDLDFYLKNIFSILEKWKSLVQIASQEFSILCVYCFLSIYCLKRYLLFTNLFFTFQKTIKFIYVFPWLRNSGKK